LFVLDILAGCAAYKFAGLFAGIITACILLFINAVVYAIILKTIKAANNGKK
jgi:tetrahydromethanopterin S-methyltransferase subunit F